MAVARQWPGKHVSATLNKHATIEELLEAVFSTQSHITTDGQSVSPSWCRAPSGAHDQILITV
jgi:hypothetical protein